jgi:hypothetical protein
MTYSNTNDSSKVGIFCPHISDCQILVFRHYRGANRGSLNAFVKGHGKLNYMEKYIYPKKKFAIR